VKALTLNSHYKINQTEVRLMLAKLLKLDLRSTTFLVKRSLDS